MNIFVGSLSYQASEDKLESLFSEFGTVTSVKIVYDNYSNRSRGFGFVEMPNKEEALKAIEKLNGTSFIQQTLVVNEARPKQPSGGSFSRGGGGNRNFGNDRGFDRDREFKKRY
jgi:RNA recognition motif-containing protein